jgi:hypothetical protein
LFQGGPTNMRAGFTNHAWWLITAGASGALLALPGPLRAPIHASCGLQSNGRIPDVLPTPSNRFWHPPCLVFRQSGLIKVFYAGHRNLDQLPVFKSVSALGFDSTMPLDGIEFKALAWQNSASISVRLASGGVPERCQVHRPLVKPGNEAETGPT